MEGLDFFRFFGGSQMENNEVLKRALVTIVLMFLFEGIFGLLNPGAPAYAVAIMSATCAVALHILLQECEVI